MHTVMFKLDLDIYLESSMDVSLQQVYLPGGARGHVKEQESAAYHHTQWKSISSAQFINSKSNDDLYSRGSGIGSRRSPEGTEIQISSCASTPETFYASGFPFRDYDGESTPQTRIFGHPEFMNNKQSHMPLFLRPCSDTPDIPEECGDEFYTFTPEAIEVLANFLNLSCSAPIAMLPRGGGRDTGTCSDDENPPVCVPNPPRPSASSKAPQPTYSNSFNDSHGAPFEMEAPVVYTRGQSVTKNSGAYGRGEHPEMCLHKSKSSHPNPSKYTLPPRTASIDSSVSDTPTVGTTASFGSIQDDRFVNWLLSQGSKGSHAHDHDAATSAATPSTFHSKTQALASPTLTREPRRTDGNVCHGLKMKRSNSCDSGQHDVMSMGRKLSHGATMPRMFDCIECVNGCDKAYHTWKSLKVHMRYKHHRYITRHEYSFLRPGLGQQSAP